MQTKTVLIVGGYGTVGSQIANILHDRHPEIELLLGGRSTGKPLPFPSSRLKPVYVDNTKADPLQHAPEDLSLILNAVNDPDDTLLLAAVKHQIPLIDVTRWTERFTRSIERLKHMEVLSPVVLASGWMGGTPALFAGIHSSDLRDVSIHMHALYSLQDKAGPDSTAYMDRMTIPFEITTPTGVRMVKPMTEPLSATFPNGFKTKCYRLDTPDHVTLVHAPNIILADFRIAFDHKMSTLALSTLVQSGIWKLLSKRARQSILYNPGNGAAHHVVVQIEGRDQQGNLVKRQVAITDPKGQTHLTAMGAAIQAQRILAKDSHFTENAGVLFPEDLVHTHVSASDIQSFFESEGVQIMV
ncbi:saccharopine dehydrogenase [Brevibacillus reuszeri]|uniref:saccharopine dehydrogenase n=1 Tax=Brevibacillus reuszeri TaxID=54915 RepID=UPI0028983C42|nr:saccharopine dehydrogenase [Brevibacillus reuszeri]